jgi:hypothetical protein
MGRQLDGRRRHEPVVSTDGWLIDTARERRKCAVGKCEGREDHVELRPDVVALARQLRPGRSPRAIAAEVASRGHLASFGKPIEPSVVARTLRVGRKKHEIGLGEQATARAFDYMIRRSRPMSGAILA